MSINEGRPPQRTLGLSTPSQRPKSVLGAATAARSLPQPSAAPVSKPAAPEAPRVDVLERQPARPTAFIPAVDENAEPDLSRLQPVAAAPKAPEAVTRNGVSADRAPAAVAQAPQRPLGELVQRRDAQSFRDLFRDLVALGISDVHMTRSVLNGTFRVDARLDGVLQPVHEYTGVEATTIATLIKTDSAMSSGVNLVPEDGNYELPIDGYPYRARAVCVPLFDGGERIVFRLPQIGPIRPLGELGFTDENLVATKALLDIPGGMTVFAGPTGEGKSTTALASLEYLRERHPGVFITLEDPVERVIPGVAQIEVKEEVEGAGFGDLMKYLVRSDPNGLFIGEIRDAATATAAVEIAKSGIRVLATIHATNNISAFLRLVEMADAAPLSVLESVNGIVSQRLVRRLVPGSSTQFRGRHAIHEVTRNSEALTDALVKNTSRREIKGAAASSSTTFSRNVEQLVAGGITTRDEAREVVDNV